MKHRAFKKIIAALTTLSMTLSFTAGFSALETDTEITNSTEMSENVDNAAQTEPASNEITDSDTSTEGNDASRDEPVSDETTDSDTSAESNVNSQDESVSDEVNGNDEGTGDNGCLQDDVITSEMLTFTPDDPDVYGTNDENLYNFMLSKAYEGISVFSSIGNTDRLNEPQKAIYNSVVEQATKVANGESTSTVFSTVLTYTYTADADTASAKAAELQAYKNTFYTSDSFSLICDVLLADNPYIFYWQDKTQASNMSMSTLNSTDSATLTVKITFTPASDYISAENTVDASKTKAASTAASTAVTIAQTHADKSTYEMLKAFKEEICDLVEYNYDAASGGVANNGINPWQLIYVFDGDTSTNVVCEGYSKAFQYLCDLAGFDDCYIVTSDTHMWNHVIVDGKSYLVDITNCDGTEGAATVAIGYPDQLFMKGMTKVSDTEYKRDIDSLNSITYVYSEDTISTYQNKPNVLALSDTDYSADATSDIDATLAGYTLSLDGKIGINFYMQLSDEIVNDSSAYMKFTLPDGKIATMAVKDARQSSPYYVFTCYVAAKEMTADVKAQMITSDGSGTEYTYCIKKYSDYILANTDKYSTEMVALVEAMLNYGGYTQTYFNYNTVALANADIDNTLDTSVDLSGYNVLSKTGAQEGITFAGTTLLLESDTIIRYYFMVDDGADVSVYNLTAVSGLSYANYYYETNGIPAKSLAEANNCTIGGYTVTYSPMTFAHAVTTGVYSDNFKNLCYAMHEYYLAATAYFNSINS